MEKQSPVGTLNTTDWKAIGKGALIAVGGAAATYAVTIIPNIDWTQFGPYAPLFTAVASVIVNILRKWVTGKEN